MILRVLLVFRGKTKMSQTFDDAAHPADITLDWASCDAAYCDWDVPTTSQVPIACEGEKLPRVPQVV